MVTLMPSQLSRVGIPIRPATHHLNHQRDQPAAEFNKTHKHSRSSYSESSPLVSRNNSLTFRPPKRFMSSPDKTIAVINASGRQAASFIRVATAVGYHVRAQLRNLEGVVATEVNSNPNVTVLVGELYTRHKPTPDNRDVTKNGPISGVGVNHDLISDLFRGTQLAFINTTFYGDEFQIGKALADAAKKANIQHYIYSSMAGSLSLQLVEEYIRKIELPATFVYTGIYNNNFTSLQYPLFCMELQTDGSFRWEAPFHEDVFAKGVGRPVKYVRAPIHLKVKIPTGYREQLEALEKLFGLGHDDPKKQPPYFGDAELDDSCPEQSMALWEGPRGLEEYAREVFPLEEQANGLTWMLDEEDLHEEVAQGHTISQERVDEERGEEEEEEDDEDEGLVMRGLKRDEEQWLA
ncbi:nitrogen metabolic regulation protein [Verticillium alfalfae VaMs.102]|uniref:Nitrogen metabolic regulation protein n=1 Tax=Verticillium alfalfae (strain VaMs.102 / ATCC MYA-4576 / FGSC 10136) TaxID=526221 RepID=C9SFU0_VERA1|nr:nitrogen metabolic regulation protein [Verticillium alfalfae VaMs.102]EEY18035.1 nitrogen metabolic regulation protein [Verticillium alfalfae VaMs.102]